MADEIQHNRRQIQKETTSPQLRQCSRWLFRLLSVHCRNCLFLVYKEIEHNVFFLIEKKSIVGLYLDLMKKTLRNLWICPSNHYFNLFFGAIRHVVSGKSWLTFCHSDNLILRKLFLWQFNNIWRLGTRHLIHYTDNW